MHSSQQQWHWRTYENQKINSGRFKLVCSVYPYIFHTLYIQSIAVAVTPHFTTKFSTLDCVFFLANCSFAAHNCEWYAAYKFSVFWTSISRNWREKKPTHFQFAVYGDIRNGYSFVGFCCFLFSFILFFVPNPIKYILPLFRRTVVKLKDAWRSAASKYSVESFDVLVCVRWFLCCYLVWRPFVYIVWFGVFIAVKQVYLYTRTKHNNLNETRRNGFVYVGPKMLGKLCAKCDRIHSRAKLKSYLGLFARFTFFVVFFSLRLAWFALSCAQTEWNKNSFQKTFRFKVQ